MYWKKTALKTPFLFCQLLNHVNRKVKHPQMIKDQMIQYLTYHLANTFHGHVIFISARSIMFYILLNTVCLNEDGTFTLIHVSLVFLSQRHNVLKISSFGGHLTPSLSSINQIYMFSQIEAFVYINTQYHNCYIIFSIYCISLVRFKTGCCQLRRPSRARIMGDS